MTQEKAKLVALMRKIDKKAPSRDVLDVQNGGLLDLDAHDGDLLAHVSGLQRGRLVLARKGFFRLPAAAPFSRPIP